MHRLFCQLALGNIMGNGRNSDNVILRISDRGCSQGNVDQPAIFLPAQGFVTDDRFAVFNPFEN